MHVIAIVVGLSIFVFAIGKIARIRNLWLFGLLFSLIVLSEALAYFDYDTSIEILSLVFPLLYTICSMSFSILAYMVAKMIAFEEKFLVSFLAPLVILYVLNIYVGLMVSILIAVLIESATVEGIFRVSKVRGVLSAGFIGSLVALSMVTWSMSPIALSLLGVFFFVRELQEMKDIAVDEEISRSGIYPVSESGEKILRLVGTIEEELNTRVRILIVDGSANICSDMAIWRLNMKAKELLNLLETVEMDEISW